MPGQLSFFTSRKSQMPISTFGWIRNKGGQWPSPWNVSTLSTHYPWVLTKRTFHENDYSLLARTFTTEQKEREDNRTNPIGSRFLESWLNNVPNSSWTCQRLVYSQRERERVMKVKNVICHYISCSSLSLDTVHTWSCPGRSGTHTHTQRLVMRKSRFIMPYLL